MKIVLRRASSAAGSGVCFLKVLFGIFMGSPPISNELNGLVSAGEAPTFDVIDIRVKLG